MFLVILSMWVIIRNRKNHPSVVNFLLQNPKISATSSFLRHTA